MTSSFSELVQRRHFALFSILYDSRRQLDGHELPFAILVVTVIVSIVGGNVEGLLVEWHPQPSLPPAHTLAQDVLEGIPKVLAEKGVYEGVDS